jgi:poly(3-hydroxybutyrate) depolymerase
MLQRLAVAALALVLSSGFGFAAGPVSITVDGLQRSYLISQPATPGPKPTIIMFHGLDGTAQDVAQASGLAAMAPQAGFVAVFPSGLGGEWNHFPDGQVPASFTLQAQHKGVPVPNDVDFVKALIGSLVSSNVADPHRIYLAGFSAGGFMAMRMLCVDPQAFAAIVLISTSMPTPTATDCNPTPIPAVMIKGTADDHVPYNGGLVLDKEFTVWSAPQLAAFFTQIDGCDPLATTNSVLPNTKTKNQIDVQSWAKCTSFPVTLYTVEGGIHEIYPVPNPSQTMWDFFKPYSR